MNTKRSLLTRRKALKGAASLLGGTIAASQLGLLTSRAASAAVAGEPPAFFDADQFSLVESMVDVMIPETDTPGAAAAGVHYFIDLMMSEWASAERQSRYVDGLAELGRALSGPGGVPFAELSTAQQYERLSAVDAAAFSDESSDHFFREFKRMALFGYYSSQPGATEELQYEALPGPFRPCMPTNEDVRAWFHVGFRHGL